MSALDIPINIHDQRTQVCFGSVGEVKRFEGTFKEFPVSREEAEEMILQARLKAGWITEADLAAEPEVADQEGAPA